MPRTKGTKNKLPRQSRSIDLTPENSKDEGCVLSETCLGCTMPQCKHDDPQVMTRAVNLEIRNAFYAGTSLEDLAGRHRVSESTIRRRIRADG